MTIKVGFAGFDRREKSTITSALNYVARSKGDSIPDIKIVDYQCSIGSDGLKLCSKIEEDNPPYLIFNPLLALTNEQKKRDIYNYERFISNVDRLPVPKTAISYITQKELLEHLNNRHIASMSLFDIALVDVEKSPEELIELYKENKNVDVKKLLDELTNLYDQILTAQKPEAP